MEILSFLFIIVAYTYLISTIGYYYNKNSGMSNIFKVIYTIISIFLGFIFFFIVLSELQTKKPYYYSGYGGADLVNRAYNRYVLSCFLGSLIITFLYSFIVLLFTRKKTLEKRRKLSILFSIVILIIIFLIGVYVSNTVSDEAILILH